MDSTSDKIIITNNDVAEIRCFGEKDFSKLKNLEKIINFIASKIASEDLAYPISRKSEIGKIILEHSSYKDKT